MSSPLSNSDTAKPQDCGELGRLRERLFEPVDIASIAVFRMMFGLAIFWAVWNQFEQGWIRTHYIDPTFYFKYFGFEWIDPWPGDGMYIHFAVIGACALCVIAGLFYRITSWLLFLGIGYWFLLDQTQYLNHLYLVVLVAFLMAVIPAHRAVSLDLLWRPKLRSDTIPAWCLWLLRMQVGIVYFYGGIAKLNGDWLQGEPVRMWLHVRSHYAVIGPWIDTEMAVWFISYGGAAFDLAVVPALLWRKTRPWAFAACLGFHVVNASLFNIGIFPVFMLAGTLLMFPPDWPRKVSLFFKAQREEPGVDTPPSSDSVGRRRLTEVFLVVYVAIQLGVPFRHFLYPGSVHWTDEGHSFAWHMMLRQKNTGVRFYAMDPSNGEVWMIDHTEYLTPIQIEIYSHYPDMCIQFAHFLGEELNRKGFGEVEIHLMTMASLHGRKYQNLIDMEVDLSKEPRNLWHAEWIVPMEDPSLPPRSLRLNTGRSE